MYPISYYLALLALIILSIFWTIIGLIGVLLFDAPLGILGICILGDLIIGFIRYIKYRVIDNA